MRIAPDTTIDGFTVGARIHAGGMADIYEVTAPDAAFPLVLKAPRLGHGEPAENVLSFEIEQTLLAALRGPHVPRFVAAGGLERTPYVVMERIEGRSLAEWTQRAPLPPDEVARVGAALARALHSLHQQECVHLDVKPSNVILRPGGEAVMVDLGLAHHAHYPDLIAEELRGPIGSAPYMSPEAVRGIRSDPRSDVFSLGAVLYELATGRLPFGTPTSFAALRGRLYREPAPPRAVVSAVPPWLQEVILRCLEPDPAERYASAAQVAVDLADPDQVSLTERARRTSRAPLRARLRRWLRAVSEPDVPMSPGAHLSSASIVLAAISTRDLDPAHAEAMREAVRAVLATGHHTRLACATVIPPIPELGGSGDDDNETRQRLKHLVRLRHWAEPLRLEPGQVSFNVLAAADPAKALLGYADANHVDHVVIGAPPRRVPASALGRVVSMQVAAGARCTVTLVRAPDAEGA